MENKFQNIDPENHDVLKLISDTFRKEDFDKEIHQMVKNKINQTDFTKLTTNGTFSSVLMNGFYYLMGILVVAGAGSVFFLSSKSYPKSTRLSNNNIAIKSDNHISEPIQGNPISQNNTLDKLESSSADTKDELSQNKHNSFKQSIENEILTIETKEYQHTQSIKIDSELSSELIKAKIENMLNGLGVKYFELSNNDDIIFETYQSTGVINNTEVNFRMTFKYNLKLHNQLIAILRYYENTDGKNTGLDLNDLFYTKLNDELLKTF